MDATFIPTLILALAGVGVVVAVFAMVLSFRQPVSSLDTLSGSLAVGTVSERRQRRDSNQRRRLVLDAASETELLRKRNSRSSSALARKLRCAQWNISPSSFRLLQAGITLLVFIPVSLHMTIFLQITALVITPLLVRDVLNIAVQRRFRAFDKDYPVMLMQLVSFVKSGMMVMTAFEHAARGLEPNSMVRKEVDILVERLRMGLDEQLALSAFGEDIDHPEIELFVQSLLLHAKVGGKITPTLERLARQVRKRQQFRKEAIAVVSMERLSIYAISGVMMFVLVYMLIKSPILVLSAFSLEIGVRIFQGGIASILLGFYWSKEVTKIRV